jgi:hypothetical protein
MKTSMLEYVKIILGKVSFNRSLFRKEYRKSLSWLSKHEADHLRAWLREQRTTLSGRLTGKKRITYTKPLTHE